MWNSFSISSSDDTLPGKMTISTSLDVLEALDLSKATGIDGIVPKICALALYKPLHYLFTIKKLDYILFA